MEQGKGATRTRGNIGCVLERREFKVWAGHGPLQHGTSSQKQRNMKALAALQRWSYDRFALICHYPYGSTTKRMYTMEAIWFGPMHSSPTAYCATWPSRKVGQWAGDGIQSIQFTFGGRSLRDLQAAVGTQRWSDHDRERNWMRFGTRRTPVIERQLLLRPPNRRDPALSVGRLHPPNRRDHPGVSRRAPSPKPPRPPPRQSGGSAPRSAGTPTTCFRLQPQQHCNESGRPAGPGARARVPPHPPFQMFRLPSA